MNPRLIEAVADFPPPESVKEVQQFLSLIKFLLSEVYPSVCLDCLSSSHVIQEEYDFLLV